MQEKLENVHLHITIKHCCVTVEKHLVFDGFLFSPALIRKLFICIVIFRKIMIKNVKVGNKDNVVKMEKAYVL